VDEDTVRFCPKYVLPHENRIDHDQQHGQQHSKHVIQQCQVLIVETKVRIEKKKKNQDFTHWIWWICMGCSIPYM
jgi:hypothetical protein